MENLPVILLGIWGALCILVGIFCSIAFICALRCIFISPENTEGVEVIFTSVFYGFLAFLCFIHVWCLMTEDKQTPKPPKTRDILLTVPEKSSVNAQVTSGNNTVNLIDL